MLLHMQGVLLRMKQFTTNKQTEAYFLFSKTLLRNINFDMLYMNKTRVALHHH